MSHLLRFVVLLTLIVAPIGAYADSSQSTRVTDPNDHTYSGSGRYPYRDQSDYVLKELDLRPGDVVVDIGAGDGWWAEKMARPVGPKGVIHAAEVNQRSVERMKERFAGTPQIKPYLCPTDGTGLPKNSCDLVFLSKTYHHLKNHVDYLRRLRTVVKPTGRVCVIERHPAMGGRGGGAHAWSPGLLTQQAEEAGWVLVRYELIGRTYHYIAIFVRQDLFPPESPRERPASGRN